MNRRRRILLAATVGLVLLRSASPAWAQLREVWVVNEESRDISIVDDPADTPATIETISLGGAAAVSPYGIAFSTFPGAPGSHAFITQGAELQVIDFETRAIVNTVDMPTLIGRPDVILRGVDAARPDRFLNASGLLELRNYLHIAADVRPAAGDPFQPWFIVVDQAALAGLVATPIVVAHGALLPPPTAGLEAMEVRVLGAPAGDRTQRAWYSFRDPGDPPSVGAVLVSSGDALADAWSAGRVVKTLLPVGATVPDSIHPGAPHSRELPLLPEGPAGTLLNLDSGERCNFAGVPRAVSVTGPGIGSHDIWVAAVDPATGSDTVQLGNWATCMLNAPVEVGQNPVDLDTLGRVEWQELYVANRDSDSVTILTAAAPTLPIEVLLATHPPGPCQKCPRSIAVRESPATVCRAVNMTAELFLPSEDVLYSWDGLGCELQDSFKLWCRCLSPDLSDCPADCVQNCPGTLSKGIGEVWCEIDVVASEGGDDGGEKNVRGGGKKKTQTTSEPNDD